MLNGLVSVILRLGIRIEHEVGQLDFTDFVAVSSLDTGSARAGNTNIVPQQDWVFEVVNLLPLSPNSAGFSRDVLEMCFGLKSPIKG